MLDSREFSKRLGVLTHEQFQAALDRFELGRLIDAQPVAGGLFGQNVFVTSTAGEWVLRGAPHYDGQFQKERFFSRLIHEETDAEAPWPFLIERSTDIFGWHYAMMPRLQGENVGDPALQKAFTAEDRIGLARAIGEYLGQLQSRTSDACATYDYAADALAPLRAPYADWFIQQVRDWVTRCRSGRWDLTQPPIESASSATTDSDLAWVDEHIDASRGALAIPFAPVIVHTDYKENNTVAERTSSGWRINGVFDLGEAYIGDGEYDLARTACAYAAFGPDVLRAFLGAYAQLKPPRAGFAERMRLYLLCDRLIIWEYGQRNHVWFKEGMTLREWAEPQVEMEIVR